MSGSTIEKIKSNFDSTLVTLRDKSSNKEFSKNLKSFCESEKDSSGMNVIYCGEPYDSFLNTKYINYKEKSNVWFGHCFLYIYDV